MRGLTRIPGITDSAVPVATATIQGLGLRLTRNLVWFLDSGSRSLRSLGRNDEKKALPRNVPTLQSFRTARSADPESRENISPRILNRRGPWIPARVPPARGRGHLAGMTRSESSRKPAQPPHLWSSRKPAQRAIRDLDNEAACRGNSCILLEVPDLRIASRCFVRDDGEKIAVPGRRRRRTKIAPRSLRLCDLCVP